MRHLLENLRRGASPEAFKLLLLGIALMGMISLYPYFIWNSQKLCYTLVSVLLLVSAAGCNRLLRPLQIQPALCGAFVLFLIYLSLLPKVNGAPTRWYLEIPFV